VIALESGGHVVAVGEAGHALDGDAVVVVNQTRLSSPRWPARPAASMRDAFLEIAVRDDGIDAMVGHGEVRVLNVAA